MDGGNNNNDESEARYTVSRQVKYEGWQVEALEARAGQLGQKPQSLYRLSVSFLLAFLDAIEDPELIEQFIRAYIHKYGIQRGGEKGSGDE